MGRKDKQAKPEKGKEKQPVPASKKPKLVRKKCKSPRGLKLEKVKQQLITVVDKPHRRHRNDYNHRIAQVKKLARML
jgi:hypothetical protein